MPKAENRSCPSTLLFQSKSPIPKYKIEKTPNLESLNLELLNLEPLNLEPLNLEPLNL